MSYYVSVIDGTRRGLLVGPYNTHGAALAMVEPTRRAVVERDQRAHFYGFGTCHHQTERRPGKLNELVDYVGDELP